MLNAIVYKSTGSWYVVKDEHARVWQARIRGVFKVEGITSTNPIAVGDVVTIVPENDLENTATIVAIADRTNYIARQSPHNKKQHHIIASNLDQTLLFATLKDPKTSICFIERFLISAEMFHVPAIIVFNKADVYRAKEMALYDELHERYTRIGYQVLLFSTHTGEGANAVKTLLHQKTTLLSGHSGVGKSSFINYLFPELQLRVQEVSKWSGKGLHTTTFAEMFDLPQGGAIIDTPGVREFGLIDIERQELSHYFPEMLAALSGCQFNNCLHVNEPGCAIKKAVIDGVISEERYVSYVSLLNDIPEHKY
jgi:ribosome biogenesis GTPase